MLNNIYTLLISLVTMVVVDSVWLYNMVPTYYRSRISHLLSDKIDFLQAGIFYILYIICVNYFVISPAIKNDIALGQVFINGAMLGLIAYATYNFTNGAVMKNYPISLSVVDTMWGVFLTGTVSVVTVYLFRYFF